MHNIIICGFKYANKFSASFGCVVNFKVMMDVYSIILKNIIITIITSIIHRLVFYWITQNIHAEIYAECFHTTNATFEIKYIMWNNIQNQNFQNQIQSGWLIVLLYCKLNFVVKFSFELRLGFFFSGAHDV